jgi:eukaryotic-like serine/threonine-protein kinase
MSDQVREGDVLAGKFRIERVLGKGAMGIVVAATHIQLEERVALKFLLPEALINADAVLRFAREARAAVKIKSEHVARVSDVGTLESGSPYMVMEYLEGQDLSHWMRDRGQVAVADAVEFLLQACEALAEAHALGIVHRDLKPANLFVTTRSDGTPCIKVLDFGISKFTTPGSSSDMNMTKTSTVMGSPLYMSPEQLSSTRSVDARADIWAIGVILFELVAGRVPFEAENMPALCRKVVEDPPPSLRELCKEAPAALEPILLRCLAKDRAQRFTNVAELATALAPLGPPSALRSAERITRVLRASQAPASPREAKSLLPPPVFAATGNAVTLKAEHSPVPQPSKRWPAWLVAGSILAVTGGLVVLRRLASSADHSPERPRVGAAPASSLSASTSSALPAVLPTPSSASAPVNEAAPTPAATGAEHTAAAHVSRVPKLSSVKQSMNLGLAAAAQNPAASTTEQPRPAPTLDPLEDRR